MFVLDVQDYRKISNYPVPIVEQDVEDALTEAGVVFDTPFALRLRLKDIDVRLLLAKSDLVDPKGDEFRLNLYFPPLEVLTSVEEFLKALNAEVRHQMAHFAQTRSMRGSDEPYDFSRLEEEAEHFAETANCRIVKELTS